VKPLPRVQLVFEPGPDTAVSNVIGRTGLGLLFSGLTVGNGRAWHARFESGKWKVVPITLPDHGLVMPVGTDPRSDIALILYQSFLQPGTLYSVDLAEGRAKEIARRESTFDTHRFVTEQLEAKSKDGVCVPYFLVRPRALAFDGQAPTVVQGYGAFGAPVLPFYSATIGNLWLERGGVYVLAAVRGGSDRGRAWYVTRTNRQHTYDDAIAVVEDLIRRKITSARRIGFEGWSAGGLLAGVMLTQRPDLFGAVLLKAPVLDEFRLDLGALGADFYTHEYGSPDVPEERAFLDRTSPFQNLRKIANFPKPLLLTSTTDETVHPAQPRRFAAKMESLGLPFFFYESSEGGHAIASTLEQRAQLDALVYTYFARQIMEPPAFDAPDDRGERAASSGPELRD
jgi:prolyl oligopeptidase